jgi:copper(I)-binding protein
MEAKFDRSANGTCRVKPSHLIFALAMLSLAACGKEKQAQAPAGPEAKPGFVVSEGRLVLPAVSGNPGAAYFNLENASGKLAVFAGVAVDGAGKAEIHQTAGTSMMKVDRIEVAPATTLKFEPGNLHVMLFDLAPRVKAGSSAEVTVTFEDGDKVSAPLKVEAAGAGGMEGMH